MGVCGQLHAPAHFQPGKEHWIAGWVGPSAGLDSVEKRKICRPYRESNPGRSARRYTD
jgi:hypothetical protein